MSEEDEEEYEDEDEMHGGDCDCRECEFEHEEQYRQELLENIEYVAKHMRVGTYWTENFVGNRSSVLMVALEDFSPLSIAHGTARVLVLDGDFNGEQGVVELGEEDLQFLEEWNP